MFAVTRCDAENTDFFKTLDALKEEYGAPICPVIIPYMENDAVKAYVDFAQGKAFAYNNGKATEVAMPSSDDIDNVRSVMIEAVASVDEELMEKYFSE